tara:strand:+ start:137 stop:298 length:162 start_codon:yes stop_codon:yes gene_type:complete
MDKNSTPRKKVMKSRAERLKMALKANMAKRKAQAEARTSNLPDSKNIEFKLED